MSKLKLTILLFFPWLIYGQEVFNKVYHFGTSDMSELLVLDSGYVAMVQDHYVYNQLDIAEYDYEGNLTDTITYRFDSALSSIENCGSCLEEYKKGRFIYAQTHFDSATYAYIHLIRFNRQWDIIQSRDYLYDSTMTPQSFSLIMDTDSTFVLTGLVFRLKSLYNIPASKYDLLVARFDTSFNLLWERRIEDGRPGSYRGYMGRDIFIDDDGSIFIGGFGFYEDNISFIFKFSRDGELLWKRELPLSHGEGGGVSIQKRSDGNYLFIAPMEAEDPQGMFAARIRFGIIDGDGNVIRDTSIGPLMTAAAPIDLIRSHDGHFIVAGYSYFANTRAYGYALKFTEDGDSIWMRQYYHGKKEDASYLFNIEPTPDSGYVMTGMHFNVTGGVSPDNAYNWLVKVDRYGCDSLGCHTIGLERLLLEELTVYPNPANDMVHIDIPEGFGKVTAELYDLRGTLLERADPLLQGSTIRVNLAACSPGVYLLRIVNEGQLMKTVKVVKR